MRHVGFKNDPPEVPCKGSFALVVKYGVPTTERTEVTTAGPNGALEGAMQNGIICAWARVGKELQAG